MSKKFRCGMDISGGPPPGMAERGIPESRDLISHEMLRECYLSRASRAVISKQ